MLLKREGHLVRCLGELKLVECFVVAMTASSVSFPEDRCFDFPLEEIYELVESGDRNEVGRSFEMGLDVFKQHGVTKAPDSLRTETGVGFPITKVTLREVTDIIAPR